MREERSRCGGATIVVAAIALFTTGCGSTNASGSRAQSIAPRVNPHLTVGAWRNGDEGMLALANGRLVVGRDGCVGLQALDASRQYVLRWPAGTHLSPDGTEVVGASGRVRSLGKKTGFGGGFGGARLPAYCDPTLWSSTMFEVQEPF